MAATLVFAGALAVAGLAGCDRGAPAGPKVAFHSTDITGASYAGKLELADADGRTRSLDDFKGKAVVVFFGYTQCPDACPTTLAKLAEVRRLLGPRADKLQAVFVSVDPERDRPEVLKAYMKAFDDSFVALRGTPEQTAEVTRDFKVVSMRVPGQQPGSYTIDHTAALYVYDPAGHVRLYVRPATGVKELAEDLRALIDGA